MTGGDGRPIDLDHAMDTIETGWPGPSWLRSLRVRVAGLVAVALVVGGLGGYYLGRQGTVATSPTGTFPTDRLLVPGGGQPPTTTGSRCSVQDGTTLELGLEILNLSTSSVTLLGAEAVLPMAGLRPLGAVWGTCGQPGGVDVATQFPLPPGATTWLRMTFEVLVPCPAPYPVQVNLTYEKSGTPAITYLGGCSDLGDIPYTGCSTNGP